MRVSKHSKTIKNTRPAASCFHQFSCVWKPRWNPRTRNVNLKEEGNAHQLIPPFKPLSTRWEWLLNLCLEANLDKRNVNTDIRKGSKFLNSNPHLTAKGQTLDFYIKMDTIFMITIIFVIIYSIWYNSYTTHLFLLASEDKEKKFTKVKSDLTRKGKFDWWKPSKASIFTVNRQKLKSISTTKQFKENLYLSRLLTTVLETLEW